jgi:uncharacterized protein (TIRG00374 family)
VSLPANLIRNLILAVIASVAFYGLWIVLTGPQNVWIEVKQLGWTGWLIILGLSLLNYLLRFGRWQLYLNRLGYSVPPWSSLKIYLAGFAFTATPGKVGEAMRSVYLNRYKVAYADSLAAFFVERLVDVVAMVLISLLAAFAFEGNRWLVVAVSLFVVLMLPVIRSAALWNLMDWFCKRLSSERLQRLGGNLLEMLKSSSALLRTSALYGGLGLSILAWVAEGVSLYVVAVMLGVEISLPLAVGIYGISILAGAVSFVPGGLGGTEIVMGALLVLAGVSEPVAVSMVLICRIATLWFAVAIGLAFALNLELGKSGASGSLRNTGDSTGT